MTYQKIKSLGDSNYSACLIQYTFNELDELIRIRYIARIKISQKYTYLGTYDTPEEAKQAVDKYKETGERDNIQKTKKYEHSTAYKAIKITTLDNAYKYRLECEKQKLIDILNNTKTELDFELINKIQNNINQLIKYIK